MIETKKREKPAAMAPRLWRKRWLIKAHPEKENGLGHFIARFHPAPMRVNAKERWRAFLGAGLGILLAGLVSRMDC